MVSTDNVFMQRQLYTLNLSPTEDVQKYVVSNLESKTNVNCLESKVICNEIEGV